MSPPRGSNRMQSLESLNHQTHCGRVRFRIPLFTIQGFSERGAGKYGGRNGQRAVGRDRGDGLRRAALSSLLLVFVLTSCPDPIFTARCATYDLVIRNGTIYDGTGTAPFRGDVAVDGDRIAAVGALSDARGRAEIDASGLAVAPGFINMLSWANESLIADGRSQGDLRQGVTLEVMGEGESMGPLSDAMKKEAVEK